MQKAYKDLDIQFLPDITVESILSTASDNILTELNPVNFGQTLSMITIDGFFGVKSFMMTYFERLF